MDTQFNHLWNPHYDFNSAGNMAEIERQSQIEHDGILSLPGYQAGGGETIQSPWGSNRTIDAGQYGSGVKYSVTADGLINQAALEYLQNEPLEFCSKMLAVNPGAMLSLQRHRGRQEVWEVTSGILTVIINGQTYELHAGQKAFIAIGACHCMINMHPDPVMVQELQTGVCREGDNVRLLDFSDRPIYPLTSESEYLSARLYARMRKDLAARSGETFNGYNGL